MKFLLIFTLFITSILSLNANALKKVKLQLLWKNQFQFAGYYMAKEKGYYKKIGIDVEIKELQNQDDITKLVLDNKIGFAIGRSSLLIDRANGKDIVALGAIFQDSPLMLLTLKNNGINKIEDLKNKRIMITPEARGSAAIISMLNSKGIKIEDVIVQKHSFNINDLINKKTDAMASYLTNEPLALKEKNIDYVIFNPKDYGFKFYDDILFTSSAFIEKNPKLTKEFYEASIKGWNYAFENITEAAEIIYKKYNTQNKTLIHLIKEGEALKKLAFLRDKRIGYLNKDVLDEIVNVYKVMGFITNEADLDEFIYDKNHRKIYEIELNNTDIYYYLIIAALSIGLIIFIIFYIIIHQKWLLTNTQLEEEIENTSKELKKLTITDELTQIYNRKFYTEKISELLKEFERYETKFSFIIFDIDNFKLINDTYGHQKGDEVLIDIANLISLKIRQTDFLFRIGGEEFVILSKNTNTNGANKLADTIRKAIENELKTIEDKTITVSVGVTTVKSGDSKENIFKRADLALYNAKENGKNKIVVS